MVLALWTAPVAKAAPGVLYVALGDSYTIGTGVHPSKAWPSLLAEHLKSDGLNIALVNLARNGYTTQDLIDKELPVFESVGPNFATLLIGANDCTRGVSLADFKGRLSVSLDRILKVLPSSARLIVLTIPDFSVTPQGAPFAKSDDIRRFNAVILDEAQKRGLTVIDLFPVSKKMKDSPDLIAPDGLHPSAKAHLVWEELTFAVVEKILK